jgi:hypothetical protein
MDNSSAEKISAYINLQSRNQVVLHREPLPNLKSVNIGQLLSESIFSLKDSGKLSMRASLELNKILESDTFSHHTYGVCLAISNLGILFEPELKVDFVRLLDTHSQNNVLFVNWEGELESDILYFLTKENGLKINIKNLSHIKI